MKKKLWVKRLLRPAAGARGMTLVELLSVMIVLLLLTTNLFLMLNSAKRIWQAQVTRTSGQQDLRQTFARIGEELKNSNVGLVRNNTAGTPKAFSFLSAVNGSGTFVTDANGYPVWQKHVIYYIPNGTNKLLKKEVYGSYTAALTQAELTTHCDGTGTLVAPSVYALELTPDAAGNSAVLRLLVRNTNLNGKTDEQSLTSTIFLRN
jgi:type II secretory pathway pseudopilin PulG